MIEGKYVHFVSDGELMGVGWMADEEIKKFIKEKMKVIEK